MAQEGERLENMVLRGGHSKYYLIDGFHDRAKVSKIAF